MLYRQGENCEQHLKCMFGVFVSNFTVFVAIVCDFCYNNNNKNKLQPANRWSESVSLWKLFVRVCCKISVKFVFKNVE